jgi:multimeric flavodoxin WrbA
MGASLIKMKVTESFPELELGKDKILGIGGSPRSGGNSDVLLKHILKGAEKEGVLIELVQLRNYDFKPCIGCEKCRKNRICTGLNDGMTLLYPK